MDFPTLRFRTDAGVGYFEKPMTFVGKVTGVREHWFTIKQGRDLQTELCIDDFYDILDGPDTALTLLLDAGLNNDVVKVALSAERLTYDNAKQIERLAKAVDEEKAEAAPLG